MLSHPYKFFYIAILAITITLTGCSSAKEQTESQAASTATVPPEATVSPTGESTAPDASAEPSTEPTVQATSTPTSTPTNAPTSTPAPTKEPAKKAATTKPKNTAAPAPAATPKPTKNPEAVQPTQKPAATPKPTSTPKPTVKPSATPKPTEKPADEVTTFAIIAKLKKEVEMGALVELEATQIQDNYDINPETQLEEYSFNQAMIMIQAGELTVVKLKSDQDYEAVAAGFEKRAETIKKSFENYLPDQYELAKDYQIVRNGKYVLFSVSTDQEKAAEVFNSFFK